MIFTVTMVPAIDVVYTLRDCLDTICTARSRLWYAAGKGINVARGVKDLGGHARVFGLAGGISGRLLQALLATDGLEATLIPASFEVRVNATLSTPGGELHIVEDSPSPSTDDLERLGNAIEEALATERHPVSSDASSCDVLVLSGHCPPPYGPDFVCTILRHCNVRTIVDTRDEALAAVAERTAPWLIKPNAQEMASVADGATDLERARSLRERSGATYVLASMGTRGALLVGDEGRAWMADAPAAEVVNTVGAGDAMVAAVAIRARESRPDPVTMLGEAVAAGCANVTSAPPGSVPPRVWRDLLDQIRVCRIA